ncbi:MAG: arginine repressor [Epulopiscium sp. Nele67-Bin004]|nr:MAG: arginine repressor [Epulopiscium sp. Nele67-Bin004]
MKEQRQSKILSLIDKYEIETQEELVETLEQAGFSVTQATISRDIRELKLTKIATKKDSQKYVSLNYDVSDKVLRVFRAGFLSMDVAQNILVIKTLPGMGNAVAAAIDALSYEEVVGTIAGDDTIFCAIRTEGLISSVIEKFHEVLKL